MPLQRIGLTALITVLATLGNVDLIFPVLGQLIQHSKSRIQNSQVLAQSPDDRKAEADRLFQQGIEQFQISQVEAALQSWQQALTIYQEIKDRLGERQTLGNLGIAYGSFGDYTKAIEYNQQSLVIAREIGDRRGEGNALGNLGAAYYFLGDYTKAIEYNQQILVIVREIKDRRGEGYTLGNLGNAYRDLGDYAKAIEYQQQRLVIAREIGDKGGEGNALGDLGIAYDSLGDYAQAIEYYQQSLVIAREVKNRRGEGYALGNLGIAYDSLGDYAKAIEYYQQILVIVREIKDRRGEGNTLGNLGSAYQSLRDYTKAIEYRQQSLVIAREIRDRSGEGSALGNLGVTYDSLGDYAKAIEYYQQSLDIAREIGDKEGEGNALGNLGVTYESLGDYAKAIEYHQQSLALKQEIKNRSGEGVSLNNIGVVLFKSGNLTQAEKILRDGIEVWESLRERLGDNDAYKVSIFEQQARTYRTLQEVLIAQNQPLPALEIAERGRARAFVELLARRNTTTNNSANSTITPPTIEQLQQIAKQQNATLVEYSIIYDDFKIKGKEETNESELYIWVIKSTGEVTFRKVDLKPLWQQRDTSLAELVLTSRESIGVRGRAGLAVVFKPRPDQSDRLKQLHKILIQPIADLLPTNPDDRVIFIPQQSLFLAPFPALQDESGKYLIEKHTILTAPSIQVLDLTRKQRQRIRAHVGAPLQINDALVVGNPTMPSVSPYPGEKPQPLAPLPGAEQEAKAIAPLLNTQPLIGNQATESVIKQLLPNARLIHLATHGLLDNFRGIGSAIALTPSGNDDGLLKAEEILNMNLNAELVVLSACDTGRGRITGDGVVGLSRSIISAGVPSVIVSLWSVPDAPTAFLMSEFYQNLQKNPDKAQALRQAMLTTMKEHPNPKDWAAFTLIGESE